MNIATGPSLPRNVPEVSRAMICRFASLSGLLLACLMASAGCLASTRQPPPSPQILAEAAHGILSGFDDLRDVSVAAGGVDVLYRVDLMDGTQPETTFLRIRLQETCLAGVDVIRINPSDDDRRESDVEPVPAAAEAGRRVMVVRDPGQPTYELKFRDWKLELKGEARDDGQGVSYEFSSGPALAWVGLYDSQGALIRARYVLLPERPLRTGFYNPVLFDLARQLEDGLSREHEGRVFPAFVENIAALHTLTAIVLSTPLLHPIVEHFIPFFVKLSALFGGMRLGLHIQDVQACSAPLEGIPAGYTQRTARIQFEVRANDKPIVAAELIAAPALSPLNACGGVLVMQGSSVADPSRRFDIRLIAARRQGSVAPSSTPARVAIHLAP